FVDVDGSVGSFLFADDENVRNLLRFPVTNFIPKFFVAAVNFNAEALIAQIRSDFVCIIELVLRDRRNDGLYRCKPGWKCAGEMLDENAKEPLHRTCKGAMNHDRGMIRTIASAIV